MQKVLLLRIHPLRTETLGVIQLLQPGGFFVFCGNSLELPFKNNEPLISCIPPGEYLCAYTQSPKATHDAGHPMFSYEIKNVPGRSGIRFDKANFREQLKGCIAIGAKFSDLNGDQITDITNSGFTRSAFEKQMQYQPFQLQIINTFL